MKNETPNNLDDLIRQALKGPSSSFDFERWKADYRDAVREYQKKAQAPNRERFYRRIVMNPKVIKYTVAAVLVVAVIIGLHHLESKHPTALAMAAVVEQIQNHSYSCELLAGFDGKGEVPIQVDVLQPGKVRFEYEAGTEVSVILDLDQGKNLILLHSNKAAILNEAKMDFTQTAPFGLLQQPIEALWNLRDGSETSLGQKEIDGRAVQGFKMVQKDRWFENQITLWADLKSGQPVEVEIITTPLEGEKKPIHWKLNHFTVDVELDPDRFKLDIPAGYTLANQKDLKELASSDGCSPEAEAMVQMLETARQGKLTEAVDLLLTVDFSKPMIFSGEPYVFCLREKEYVSLKYEDQQKVMKEMLGDGALLRNIAREAIARSKDFTVKGDMDSARKLLEANQNMGSVLNRDPEQMLIVRMVGMAIEVKTLKDLIPLYQTTQQTGKQQTAEKRRQELEAQSEAIRQNAGGRK